MRIAFIVLAASAALCCAQTDPGPPTPASRPVPKPEPKVVLQDDPQARSLFERVAEIQAPMGGGFAVLSFRAQVELTVVKKRRDGAGGRVNSGSVEWRYWKENAWNRRNRKMQDREWYWRYLKQLDGKELWTARQANRSYLREKGQGLVSLDVAEYKEDRQQLDDELRQASRLARFFILHSLTGREACITFGEKDVKIPIPPRKDVLTREIRWRRETKEEKEDISFFIGPDDYVYQVSLHSQKKDVPDDILRFSYHRYREPGDAKVERFKRILVPCKVEFWKGKEKQMVATAKSAKAISFNTVLDKSHFDIPTDK